MVILADLAIFDVKGEGNMCVKYVSERESRRRNGALFSFYACAQTVIVDILSWNLALRVKL